MENTSLQWSSSGHAVAQKNSDWFWILWIITASIALSALIFRDPLTAALIGIAGVTLTLLAQSEAASEDYTIDKKGVTIDARIYPFENLLGFEIIERSDMQALLIITTPTVLNPHLFIHLSEDVSVEDLRKFLEDMLPETDAGIPLSHQIVEYLGL